MHSPSDQARADLWEALVESESESRLGRMEEVESLPSIVALVEATSTEDLIVRADRERRLLRAALLEGTIDPWLEELRRQGRMYADDQLDFQEWHDFIRFQRERVILYLSSAYQGDMARREAAQGAHRWYVDVTLTIVVTAYLEAREDSLRSSNRHLEAKVAELSVTNHSLDEFAQVASHDLKAPLRDIHNLTSWLEEDLDGVLPAASSEHLKTLRDRVGRMDRLLDDLLRYFRATRDLGRLEDFNLAGIVQDAGYLAGIDGRFELVLPSRSFIARGPRVGLELVLRNLISNAIKHHDRDHGAIHVEWESSARRVNIQVADDGPGIPEQYHDRVFRMFQTLRSRDDVEASGIGLALVRKLVEAHGGTVSISGGETRGTTFSFSWPAEWVAADEGAK